MSGFAPTESFHELTSQSRPGWRLRACFRRNGHRDTELAFGMVRPDGTTKVPDIGHGVLLSEHPRHEIRCLQWIVDGCLIEPAASRAIWAAFWLLEIEAHADAGTTPWWSEHWPEEWAFWEKARARERACEEKT